MTKHIYILVIAILSITALSSCTIESIDNGHLDGFWHIEKIDTLETGGRLDLSENTIFWAIQAKLMHTQGYDDKFFFRFKKSDKTLTLSSPHLDRWHQDQENGGDHPVEDPAVLHPYGIQDLEETFTIEVLKSSKMVLSSQMLRIHFRKF